MSNEIGNAEIYHVLFEKTDLSKISFDYLNNALSKHNFSYENKIYEKIPTYINFINIKNYKDVFDILRNFRANFFLLKYYQKTEEDAQKFQYIKESIYPSLVASFHFFEKNQIVLSPEENFDLFTTLLICNTSEDKEKLYLRLNLNFEDKLQNKSSVSNLKLLREAFDKIKILQEKEHIESKISDIDSKDKSLYNKPIFKI